MGSKISILGIGIALALMLNALPVRAAILPSCDQTKYVIAVEGQFCNPANPEDLKDPTKCTVLDPAEYEKKYPTQELKEQNPPTITTLDQCGFNDFVQLFINLATYGLGILAALALLIAVWGGFTFVTAAGNQERIRQAKQTLWGGFLGVVIVLTSWIIVGGVVSTLSGTGPVLFAGTDFERRFYGSLCPSYERCDLNDLHFKCRDDTRRNDNGVSKAQAILAAFGCYADQVDGCFGKKTRAAVEGFQAANKDTLFLLDTNNDGIPEVFSGLTVDGIIGPKTWTVLTMGANGDTSVKRCGYVAPPLELKK